MFHVTFAFGLKVSRHIGFFGYLLEFLEELIEAYPLSISNIDRFADTFWRCRGLNICVDDIGYISEVARLLPVALDHGGLASH